METPSAVDCTVHNQKSRQAGDAQKDVIIIVKTEQFSRFFVLMWLSVLTGRSVAVSGQRVILWVG